MSVLLVTANVGSLFEDPRLISCWVKEFAKEVLAHDARMVALHMQEVGGKKSVACEELLQKLLDTISKYKGMRPYNRTVGYVDTDDSDAEKYTALGSVYLLHRDLADVDRYDYDDRAWSPLSGAPGSAVQCNGTSPHVRKTKFVLGQFGVMRSSRKGGLRTGWRINGRPLQMVNVHLFADVSNIDAAAQTPSKDALIRRAALEFLIDGVSDPAHESDDSGGPAVEESTDGRPGKRSRKGPARAQLPEAAFFFGDFNFRLANSELAQHISSGSRGKFCRNRPDHPPTKVVYNKRGSGAPALVLEKKKFLVTDPDFYAAESLADLRQFDLEGNEFDTLLEMERRFLPSYPFVDSDGPAADSGQVYAKTRAPAWCDRVLMNPQARSLVKDDSFSYFCIGENVPMGDHKPVALALQLI